MYSKKEHTSWQFPYFLFFRKLSFFETVTYIPRNKNSTALKKYNVLNLTGNPTKTEIPLI
jgi:hypothetical protein